MLTATAAKTTTIGSSQCRAARMVGSVGAPAQGMLKIRAAEPSSTRHRCDRLRCADEGAPASA
jgi:hypothetical protein